jgi:bacillithiol synthase
VLDASHDGVRAASDTVLRRALACASTVERALLERRADMERVGYTPQVDDVKGLSLVFVREAGVKRRVSISEGERYASGEAHILTPNVLLRPVVEANILPTIAYVGGPGEISYFAQVGAVAGALAVEQPLVVPRWSCTLIEPHVESLLQRFGVQPDVLARPDNLETAIARTAMPPTSHTALSGLREAVGRETTQLAADFRSLGMEAAIAGAARTLQHRVERLERRLVAALKRSEHEQLRDVATLRAALYPMGKRQERALNLIPTLSRHGCELLAEMRDAAGGHARALIAGP